MLVLPSPLQHTCPGNQRQGAPTHQEPQKALCSFQIPSHHTACPALTQSPLRTPPGCPPRTPQPRWDFPQNPLAHT